MKHLTSSALSLVASLLGIAQAEAISLTVHAPTSFAMGCSLAAAAKTALQVDGVTHAHLVGPSSDGWNFTGYVGSVHHHFDVSRTCVIKYTDNSYSN